METDSFHAVRRVQRGEQRYEATPETVFPLLCPVREYDWLEMWDCTMVWSASGVAEQDCVFTTAFPDAGREVWVVSRYEPGRAIEFVRISAHQATRLVDQFAHRGEVEFAWGRDRDFSQLLQRQVG